MRQALTATIGFLTAPTAELKMSCMCWAQFLLVQASKRVFAMLLSRSKRSSSRGCCTTCTLQSRPTMLPQSPT